MDIMAEVIPDNTILRMPDCDALTEKGGCTRLNVTVCIGEKCSFCTSAGRLSSSEISSRRLSSLPEDEQKRISKKYYGGLMPWK